MAAPMIPPARARISLPHAAGSGARIEPLAGDASFRRYFRVCTTTGAAAVLMDAPPPHEDPRPFVAVAEWLASIGLSAPRTARARPRPRAAAARRFRRRPAARALDADAEREARLYAHGDRRARPPSPPSADGRACRSHGLDQWLDELALFTDWYRAGGRSRASIAEAYRAAWREVLAPVADDGLGPVTVLRDYHAENIMLVPGRSGIAHFGLLDFQDALAGHPAYDLASVLEDARRDVSPAIERAMIDRYRGATDDPAAFEARLLGARRAAQHAHPRRLRPPVEARRQAAAIASFQPRMWGLLERDLAHPALAPVRDWFDANVPAASARRRLERAMSRRDRAMALRPADRRACRARRWSWPRGSASACVR